MISRRRTLKSNKGMVKGLGLLAVFVVMLVLMNNMQMLTVVVEQMLTPRQFDFAALEATNELRKEYYGVIAGFWEHSSDTLFDRIEMMDDGIIWQYTEYMFMTPRGEIDTLKRISTSFLHPVSFGNDNSRALSDFRMIREIWIRPDTCFGRRTFIDFASSDFLQEDDVFIFNNVAYTRFDGDIKEFFPVGALALLRPNPITFAMLSCNTETPVRDWIRRRIIQSFENRQINAADIRAERQNLLENFFIPLCLTRIEARFEAGQEWSLDLRVVVAPDGSVDTVLVRGRGFASQASRLPIINEAKLWKFPTTDGQTTADTLHFVGTLTQQKR